MKDIIVALITGGMALVGVIVSNQVTAQRTASDIRTAQAVTDTKIEDLTREVREHNGFAKRMPVVEEQITIINSRVHELEKYHKEKL